MNILGIGPLELALIIVLALIFLGPEELPVLMRKVGHFVRELQDLTADVTEQVREELGPEFEEVTRATQDIQRMSQEIGQAIQQPAAALLTHTMTAPPSDSATDGKPSSPAETTTPAAPAPTRRPLAPPPSAENAPERAEEEES